MAEAGRAPRRKLGYGFATVYFVAATGLWRASFVAGRKPDGRADRRIVSARTEKACREKLLALRQGHAAGTLSNRTYAVT